MGETGSSGIAKRRKSKRETGKAVYQARRQEILDVAATIFRQKGYGGTSATAIAEAANIDRATLYYYSGSKTELYQEVVQRAVEHNVTVAERIAASEAEPVEKIRQFVDEMLESFRDQHPYMRSYWQEDMEKIRAGDSKWAKGMADLGHRFDQAVIEIVADGQKKGVIRKSGEPRLIAYAIIGLLNSVLRWFKPADGFTSTHIATVFSGILLSGIAES